MGSVALFAFVLFVMGGITAYMGDRLGSYIGKKRHSTFGLRPRHTAMLWTVVSGGAIAVGTLTLLFILDNTVKTALLQGPELVAQKAMLERQNTALTRRNTASEQRAQADLLQAAHAQAKADAAQEKLSAVAGELAQAKTSLLHSQTALEHRQATLAAAQGQLLAARTGLGHTQAELTGAEQRVRSARRGVIQAQQQYQVASSQVVQANKSVLDLVIQQDRLHSENSLLTSQNKVQQGLLQNSQGHSLIFRREEELGRTVISARQAPESLRRELAVFLDQIELIARKRGAGSLDNSPAIVIPVPIAGTEGGPAAREAALDALSQNIADQSGFMPSIVVVADARFNTFRGEAVKLDLRPYANVMVFPKGTAIADSVIDGTQSDDMILKQLQRFLVERVRPVALSKGIIPILDPESGETLVGQPINSETWLARVKQIRQIGSDAHVTAFVNEDTYSGDLLRLELSVTARDASAAANRAGQ